MKNIFVECECGHLNKIENYDIIIQDVTPCSCGQCRGEVYKIEFEPNCEKCNKDLGSIEI